MVDRTKKYSVVAESVNQKIVQKPGVIGVISIGRFATSQSDEFSDLDLIVFVDKSEFQNWSNQKYLPINNQTVEGVWVDIKIYDYQEECLKEWSQERRQERLNAKILFDKEGKVSRLLEKKLIWYENEQRELIERLVKRANWYIQEVVWIWFWRGDIFQAHYCLNQALDWLLEYCYVSKNRFIPFGKWKYHLIRKQKLVSVRLIRKIEQFTLIRDVSERELKSRINLGVEILKLMDIFAPLEFFGSEEMNPTLYDHYNS
jgi:hypothetical protein